ncbi:MAG: hypothetical protein V4562_06410 [Pseudomonadota bacterium]
MTNTSVGQGAGRDGNENVVNRNQPAKKTFGEEGSNKTQKKPDPHAQPSDVPNEGKYVGKSPFVR